MSVFVELKRRNVFKVGAAYLVVSWLLIQVVDTLGDLFALPEVVGRSVVILLAIGFPVALVIAWIYEVTPTGITTQDAVDAGATTTSGRKLNAVIVSALVLVVIFMAVDNYVLVDDVTDAPIVQLASDSSTQNETDATADTKKSLVVLPFNDLSPASDQGWLADGISTEINALLTRIPDLFVINTNSAFQLREQADDYTTLRDVLGVNYLLTGDLRRINDDMRVTVRLSDTRTGEQLWATTYDRQIADVFEVQADIATEVSRAMQVSLATGNFGRLPGMTRNVDAYEEYLKGVQARRDGETVENIRRAISHMERALSLDPDYVMPSLQIFNIYGALLSYISAPVDFPERDRRQAEARAHIESVTPDSPYLRLLEIVGSGTYTNPIGTESQVNEFLESMRAYGVPESEFALEVSLVQLALGKPSQAISLLERLRATDPLNGAVIAWLSEALSMNGQLDRSRQLLRESLSIPGQENNARYLGNHLLVTLAYGDPGLLENYPLALPGGGDGSTVNQELMGLANNPAQGLEFIRRAATRTDVADQYYNVLAAWAAFYGDNTLSVDLLKIVFEDTTLVTNSLMFRPIYKEVRQQEGFKEILQNRGLVDYWRSTGDWGDFCRPLPDSDTDFECYR